MDINVQATIGECSEFIGDDGLRRVISVAIAPLKVNLNETQDRLNIISGCNMWKSCHNPDCFYSLESRKRSGAERDHLKA